MPQATDELRRKWGGVQGVGEDKAIEFLEGRGYILRPNSCWFKPKHVIQTEEDEEAVEFLFQEWDYGGIISNDEGKITHDCAE